MSVFGWVGKRHEPPRKWDLRRSGWTLAPVGGPVRLVDAAVPLPGAASADPTFCLYLGVDCGRERARLLAEGAGDALPADVGLAELEQRARRLAAARECLPRRRGIGLLTLDLLHRVARVANGWLSLHPREFELLWRLAERPGECVSRARLLREVWRLDFEPGTNSVEVHVSRLRTKLAAAGITGLVATDPAGGYRLAAPQDATDEQRLCLTGFSCYA